MLALVSARLLVALVPFPWLTRLLVKHSTPGCSQDDPEREALRAARVRWAITSAARFPVPWAVCLPQALAAHWLLARRHIGSRICFGVNRGTEGLQSHAWLVSGQEIVIGGQTVGEFAYVAEYPPPERKE